GGEASPPGLRPRRRRDGPPSSRCVPGGEGGESAQPLRDDLPVEEAFKEPGGPEQEDDRRAADEEAAMPPLRDGGIRGLPRPGGQREGDEQDRDLAQFH